MGPRKATVGDLVVYHLGTNDVAFSPRGRRARRAASVAASMSELWGGLELNLMRDTVPGYVNRMEADRIRIEGERAVRLQVFVTETRLRALKRHGRAAP